MKTVEMTCIVCPIGCDLKVTLDDEGHFVSVKGNRCPKGELYARDEVTDPKRVLTSSVKVVGGKMSLVSVKTDRTIPKRLIRDTMSIIKSRKVKAPVKMGDVIVENILDTGSNVVATRTVDSDE
jgi:CxxC motif-containing protein